MKSEEGVVPPGVVRVTFACPAAAVAAMLNVAVTWVAFTTTTLFTVMFGPALITTSLAKFVPTMVTGTAVPIVPVLGVIELMVGAGGGSGVLTYRGRDYPFRVSGLSLGVTAGASVSRLEGWASGIRQVSDFAGTYGAVGAGGALVGGAGGVHLVNEKGVRIALQGPKAGMEFAANLSSIKISLK